MNHTTPRISHFTGSLTDDPCLSARASRFFRKCAKYAKKYGGNTIAVEHIAQALYDGAGRSSNRPVTTALTEELSRFFREYPAVFFPPILLGALRFFNRATPGAAVDLRVLESATDMFGCTEAAIVHMISLNSAVVFQAEGIVVLLNEEKKKVLVEDVITFARLLSVVEQTGSETETETLTPTAV